MRNAVGLDISQKTFDAAAIVNGHTKQTAFENNADGFEKFKKWLDAFHSEDLHICMEATGNYFEDVADYIGQFYTVSVINPYKISEYGKSRFHRTKTDRQDAKLIAEYCHTAMSKDLPARQKISHAHYRLKRVLTLYEQLKAEKTAQINRQKVAKDEFVRQMHQTQIEELDKHIRLVEAEIQTIVKDDSNLKTVSDSLQTIPAIGKLTAAILTNYLLSGDFKTANQFTAFAGLNPQKKESGTSVKGRSSMTRYGNRRLKAALFMPAMVALNRNYFPDFVKRLEAKNKPKMLILGALMRKLIVIAFNIYRKSGTYNPGRYKSA
ncbi:IS110 family transposase [Neisseria weixii]|uniref:Transposase n=1 Tax=Neisseria weixii TaxID=1853276 RepID=A0A3N4MIW2_9NEIS|nr:transposase [Neisseria weixii]RPD83138.1 transposase [Neisseria weixii]RPD86707.1 transposase [Neisseria weixii]